MKSGIIILFVLMLINITVPAFSESGADSGNESAPLDLRDVATREEYSAGLSRSPSVQKLFGVPFGCNGAVFAAVADPSGTVYLGGAFSACGNAVVSNIARYNPVTREFSRVGNGDFEGVNGEVRQLALMGQEIIVSGSFSKAGAVSARSIARWNGVEWSAFGREFPGGSASTLLVVGQSIFVGGYLGDGPTHVWAWDGSNWAPLGAPLTLRDGNFGVVRSLAMIDGVLYVGGRFGRIGDLEANNIARRVGGQWQSLGPIAANGVLNEDTPLGNALVVVEDIVQFRGDIHVSGEFISAGGQAARNVARWDGARWWSVGSGAGEEPRFRVDALSVFGNELYATGSSVQIGGSFWSAVSKWNGASWSIVGEGFNHVPLTFIQVNNELWTAGFFSAIVSATGQEPANYLARWTGVRWSALGAASGSAPNGAQANGGVYALNIAGGSTYVAGAFTRAGLTPANSIAEWTVSGWSVLGSGETNGVVGRFQNGIVRALALRGDELVVGGAFAQAGGIPANNVAIWNRANRSWAALGSGSANGVANDTGGSTNVHAIEVVGQDVFVGGWFTQAGGQPASNIARWNGQQWLPLGSGSANGVDGDVYALKYMEPYLYVAGDFTRAGGQPASNIARWTGSAWEPLGNPESNGVRVGFTNRNYVNKMVVSDRLLYVGGNFRVAGGRSANGVARWDGAHWSPLGADFNNGVDHVVFAMETVGSELYVGGVFQRVGGQPASGLARWDGTDWTAVEQSNSGQVFRMASDNGRLITSDFDNLIREISVPSDEPALQRLNLPVPSPANAACPAGFFSASVEDGPAAGVATGLFGMELLLNEPGARVLEGGLNFGGLLDAGQPGFAGFNFANSANEPQRLNLRLTGSSLASAELPIPVRIRIERRSEAGAGTTAFEATTNLTLATAYSSSIELAPGFYAVTVLPTAGSPGGPADGQFFFELTTSFVNRPGGGFQGGAVVGGYHAAHPFGGVSGFAAFCLATPHSTNIRVLSRPSYGPSGARDLRLVVRDSQRRELMSLPRR